MDGICVSDSVADYVSCVRAQGAKLDADTSKRLSADAGYAGAKGSVAADVSDKLQKQYAASDTNVLEVIRGCNAMQRTAPREPTSASQTWRPRARYDDVAAVADDFGSFGAVIAKSDFSEQAPKLLPAMTSDDWRSRYEGGRWLFSRPRDDDTGKSLQFQTAEPPDYFMLHVRFDLVESSSKGGARVVWVSDSERWGEWLYFYKDGSIWLRDYDWTGDGTRADDFTLHRAVQSKTAALRGTGATAVVRRGRGAVDVWIDGEVAFHGEAERAVPVDSLWLGADNSATVAFDDLVVVRLP